MRTIPPETGFFILLVAGVLLLVLPFSAPGYGVFCLLLALLPGLVLYLTRRWPDRAFYLTGAGQPAVIACGMAGIGAGLVAALMLGGMVAGTLGLLSSREDYYDLLPAALLLIGLSLLTVSSNHVLFLLVALGAGGTLLAGVLAVRAYQFRKECAGAPP